MHADFDWVDLCTGCQFGLSSFLGDDKYNAISPHIFARRFSDKDALNAQHELTNLLHFVVCPTVSIHPDNHHSYSTNLCPVASNAVGSFCVFAIRSATSTQG